jgi:hypothetical protein
MSISDRRGELGRLRPGLNVFRYGNSGARLPSCPVTAPHAVSSARPGKDRCGYSYLQNRRAPPSYASRRRHRERRGRMLQRPIMYFD